VVFVIDPATAEVMATETAQLPLEVSEPPVRLMVVAAAAAEKVPPQVFVAFGVLATCMLVGRLSLTATPD
jgi:hypothetical protein